MAGQMTEVELGVGGQAHAAEHDDDVDRIAFTGRLVADSNDLSIAHSPRVCVYQTHTGKLIVYRSWKGTPAGEARGATYRDYADYDALTRQPSALGTESLPSLGEWMEGTKDENDDARLTKGLRAMLMKALGKPVVVRLD